MRLFLFVFFCITCCVSLAQKHDNVWTLGIGARDKNSMKIDFSGNKPKTISDPKLPPFDFYCSSMADSMGRLIFYSNGLHIYNTDYNIMLNGDTVNPGKFWEIIEPEGSYGYAFSGMTIPYPNHANEYLHFHFRANLYHVDIPVGAAPLYLSRIDMSLDNGLGAVVEKNVPLLPPHLRYSRIDITKHANGRDWWVMVLNFLSRDYYSLLITPEGVTKYEYLLNDVIGEVTRPANTKFSPDGSKFAVANKANFVTLFDFDRCTGLLSNRTDVYMPIGPELSGWNSTLDFSLNSDFLYVGNIYEIYQINVDSKIDDYQVFCVAECDLHWQTLNTSFVWSQMGPNGKIYFSTGNGNEILHVINRPNLSGIACDVQQHGFLLPEENFLGIPHFPNYRLGALKGSPCDTINTMNPNQIELIDSINGDFKFLNKWYKYAYKP